MDQIKILAAESLGVRSLCCLVEKEKKRILIDSGFALGYTRHGLHPHPIQAAVVEIIRQKIMEELKETSDLVFSHFHGDHIPFEKANVYQLNLKNVRQYLKTPRVWSKSIEDESHKFKERAWDLRLNCDHFTAAEGLSVGDMTFSQTVPHGEKNSSLGNVMMTKIKVNNINFVHASDIQFLYTPTIERIMELSPDIVIASGPPLYLSHVDKKMAQEAASNILYLSNQVDNLIVDHHLLRSEAGLFYLRELNEKSHNKIISAADFMGIPPFLLEARREELYDRFTVPAEWHQKYEAGLVDTSNYLLRARNNLPHFEELLSLYSI